jgi:hypothetical protein
LFAFDYLSSKRTVGFSCENPISMMDISAYLQVYPTDNIDLFMYLINEMDKEYLLVRSKKQPSNNVVQTGTES